MIKSDKSRERVPARFQEKRPDRTRPSTPEPELQTDPTQPQAPQVGATPQLVAEEYNMPEGYVPVPGSYQSQRVWRDNDSPDAFTVAEQECHADALRANRDASGIPMDMEYVGYSWQLARDGNGVLYNTIYANYMPAAADEEAPPPEGGATRKPLSGWGKAGRMLNAGGDRDSDKQRQHDEEERKRKEREKQGDLGQGKRPYDPSRPVGPDNQPDQPGQPGQPGQQPFTPPPGQHAQPYQPPAT